MDKLNEFISELKNTDESMDSLIIYKNGSGYISNKKNDEIFDTRSIAKTVLSLSLGILIEQTEGDFSLDTKIYPLLENKINLTYKKNLYRLKEIKVRHLLTHTTGYRDLVLPSTSVNVKDYDKIFDYVTNYPLYYKPGTHFLYSNAGYYLLAATMQEYLGYDLLEFIRENLYRPLNISGRDWGRYGDYISGATKARLCADDLLKFGKLIMNKGKYNGKQIVNTSYIEQMTKPHFTNPNETKRKYLSEDMYGLGIWLSESGIVFASGTGGQLIVLIDEIQTIVVTTNSGSDSKSHRIKFDVDKLIKLLLEA